jgi:phage gpG-like protein
MSNEISTELKRKAEALKKVLNNAPRVIGSMAVTHFKTNFRKQGFEGVKWPKRSTNRAKDAGRAIMIKKGRLMNSIRVASANTKEIVIGTNVPYAKIHNEGGTISQAARSETFARNRISRGARKGLFKKGVVNGKQGFTYKARNIKIPKRQFIGEDAELTKKVDHWYTTNINKAINI